MTRLALYGLYGLCHDGHEVYLVLWVEIVKLRVQGALVGYDVFWSEVVEHNRRRIKAAALALAYVRFLIPSFYVQLYSLLGIVPQYQVSHSQSPLMI